uniref:Putative capsid protein n=1 Tax=viral metagenome TaxID=1070528 RepID=A0A6M3KUW9_9ZZZZ
MRIKLIVKDVDLLKLPEGSIVDIEDTIAKEYIEKKTAIEYTDDIAKQERDEKIKTILETKMTQELEVKDGAKIEVKAPTVEKKSFGETIQMICKATTGQNITAGADGGYLTYTELFREIVDVAIPGGVIWPKCTKIQLGDRATAITIPYLNNTGNTATSAPRYYPVEEGGQKTVTKLAFGKQTLTLFKQVVRIPMTWEIMEDVGIIEGYVKQVARQRLDWLLDYMVFSGVAGTNGYIGICTAAANAFRAARIVAATITKPSIINLVGGVLPQVRQGAEFWMSNAAWCSMMEQCSTATAVTPSFGSMVDISGKTVMGYPVNVSEQLAALNTNYDILFGNPKTYYIAYKNSPKEMMTADFRWDYNESELVIEFRSAGAPCLPSQTLIDGGVCSGFSSRA